MLGARICLIIALIPGSLAIAATVDQNQSDANQAETSSSEAQKAFVQGWQHYRRETPIDFGKAAAYFEQAIEFDPDYARAHAALAAVYWNSAWRAWVGPFGLTTSQLLDQARKLRNKAMESPSALSHQIASEMAAYFRSRPKKALAEAEYAIALDAKNPAAHLAMANALLKAKKPAEAIASMQQAMQLNSQYPGSYLTRLGRGQFALGRYAEAATTLERSTELNPEDDRAFVYLAASYGYLGHTEEAKSAIDSLNRLRSDRRWGNITTEEINRWRWTSERKDLKQGLILAGAESGYEWRSRLIESGNKYEIRGATPIDTQRAKQLHEAGVPFVDISTVYVQARVPGAHNLRWGRFKEMGPREFNVIRLLELSPESGEIVIYHPHGDTVVEVVWACAYAAEQGFQNVYYYRDGLEGWRKAGYPVETGK